jgi:hypothetical protein
METLLARMIRSMQVNLSAKEISMGRRSPMFETELGLMELFQGFLQLEVFWGLLLVEFQALLELSLSGKSPVHLQTGI